MKMIESKFTTLYCYAVEFNQDNLGLSEGYRLKLRDVHGKLYVSYIHLSELLDALSDEQLCGLRVRIYRTLKRRGVKDGSG